jgi:copper chaperone CopZ
VADASVSLTNQLAMIAYDTNQVSVKQLVGVIKEAGYGAKLTQPR